MGKHLHVHRLDVHWQLVDLILQVPQYIMRAHQRPYQWSSILVVQDIHNIFIEVNNHAYNINH